MPDPLLSACRAALAGLLWAAAFAGAAGPQAPAAIHVGYESGLLTVSAESASLGEVLSRVAEQSGVRVFVSDELAGRLGHWSVTAKPLAEALGSLVRPHSVLIVHERDPVSGDLKVTEVHVLDSGEPIPGSVPPGAPVALPGTTAAEPVSAGVSTTAAGDAAGPGAAAEAESGEIEEVGRWSRTLSADLDPHARRRAVSELERLGGEAATVALERGLADQAQDIRLSVVEALGRTGEERAVTALGRAAVGDPDPRVRAAAVELLGRDGGDMARAFLQQALRDGDAAVREAATRALGADAAQSGAVSRPAAAGANPSPGRVPARR